MCQATVRAPRPCQRSPNNTRQCGYKRRPGEKKKISRDNMAATLRCTYGLRGLQGIIPRLSQCRQISGDDSQKDKPHPETPQFPNEHPVEPPKGKIYDKKPFKMALKAEKNYHWCACGTSKNQPMCDGSHKQLWGTSEKKTGYKWQPLPFQVEKEKEYWLCNCKQTSKPPFCDGTHKQPQIQAAIK